MDNQVLMERIRKWQEEPVFHVLTCGNDSNHTPLKPDIRDDKVILFCSDCNYVQSYIPDLFYEEDFDEVYNKQKEYLETFFSKFRRSSRGGFEY